MKQKITKSALAISIALMIVWAFLGTTSTIAWFSDKDEVVNTFQFGNFDLEVYRRLPDGRYERVTETTKLFDDEALYEPGYTQVIYLKVRNEGDVPFDYKLSVLANNTVDGTNVYGQPIHLPNYLRFGTVVRDTETEMLAAMSTREAARSYADKPLNNYDEKQTDFPAGGEHYIAIVVCMPEVIGNEANFRAKEASVDMSIKVTATQTEARTE